MGKQQEVTIMGAHMQEDVVLREGLIAGKHCTSTRKPLLKCYIRKFTKVAIEIEQKWVMMEVGSQKRS